MEYAVVAGMSCSIAIVEPGVIHPGSTQWQLRGVPGGQGWAFPLKFGVLAVASRRRFVEITDGASETIVSGELQKLHNDSTSPLSSQISNVGWAMEATPRSSTPHRVTRWGRQSDRRVYPRGDGRHCGRPDTNDQLERQTEHRGHHASASPITIPPIQRQPL